MTFFGVVSFESYISFGHSYFIWSNNGHILWERMRVACFRDDGRVGL